MTIQRVNKPISNWQSKMVVQLKAIQRKTDSIQVKKNSFPNIVNTLMEKIYFGRKFWVMVFKDIITRQIFLKQYVKQETNNLYLKGIEEITRRGIKIQPIICDGHKGLLQFFEAIPTQM